MCDDLDFILIEGVTLFSYDFDHGWISPILRMFIPHLWFQYLLT